MFKGLQRFFAVFVLAAFLCLLPSLSGHGHDGTPAGHREVCAKCAISRGAPLPFTVETASSPPLSASLAETPPPSPDLDLGVGELPSPRAPPLS